MTSGKIYTDLQNWTAKGVKILFVGDGVQLPPILSHQEEKEFGEDFIIFKHVTGPGLTKVMRSGDDIIDVVSAVRETKRFPTVGNKSVRIEHVRYPGLVAIKDYIDDPEDHVLITWTNKMRMQGNLEIRRKLGHKTKLPGPTEPVLICKNGKDRLNGEIVHASSFKDGPTIAGMKTSMMTMEDGTEMLVSTSGNSQFMDGSLPDIKDWREFHKQRNKLGLDEPVPVTYGYVLTCHKSQGSEFRRVSVYLSGDDMSNQHFTKNTTLSDGSSMPFSIRWFYTAATRSKSMLSFYHS